MFEKGNKLGKGRPKGSKNKTPNEIREAYKNFVSDNIPQFQEWLERVAQSNPAKALELIVNISEFFMPKMNRTELKHDVDEGFILKIARLKDEDEVDEIKKLN